MEYLQKAVTLFEQDGLVSLLTFALSVIAIMLSVISLMSSRSSNRKLLEIERGRDAREADKRLRSEVQEKKARLVVRREREPRPGKSGFRSYLVVENQGIAEASNVQIKLDNDPNHNYLRNSSVLPVVGSSSSARVSLLVTSGTKKPETLSVSWSNKDGSTDAFSTAY